MVARCVATRRGSRRHRRHQHRDADAARACSRGKGMNHTTIAAVRATRRSRFAAWRVHPGDPRASTSRCRSCPRPSCEHGDVITFYGSPQDTKRAVDAAGYELPYTNKTDFIYMGVGIVLGLVDRADRGERGRHSAHARLGRRLPARGSAVRLDARQASDVWRDAVGGLATAEGLRSCRVRRGGGAQFGPAGGGDGEGKRHDDLPARRVRHAVPAAG